MFPHNFQTQFNALQTWKNIVDIFMAGCPRGRHSRLLTVVEDSFTGREALSYLFEALLINPYTQEKLTKEQTVKLLETMLKEKVFVRISAKKKEGRIFKLDGIYRFAIKRKVSEESIEVARCSQCPLPVVDRTDRRPQMNKVDIWNCYRTGFFTRLYQLVPSDYYFSLEVQGSTVWRNCEEERISDLFPDGIQSQMNYLIKLPFSLETPNAVKVFDQLCHSFSQFSFLTELEAMSILDMLDEISGHLTKQSAISLLLLVFPTERCRRLEAVLRLTKKISQDDLKVKSLALEHLSKTLVSSDRISGQQITNIVQYLLSNVEELFVPDREFTRLVEEEKEKILKQRIVPVSEPIKKETKAPRRRNELFDVISILGDYEKEQERPVEKKPVVKRVERSKRRAFFRRLFQKN